MIARDAAIGRACIPPPRHRAACRGSCGWSGSATACRRAALCAARPRAPRPGMAGFSRSDGVAQATHQHHVAKRIPLRRRFAGREVRPVPDRIAQLPEPVEGGVFDDGFVELLIWHAGSGIVRIRKRRAATNETESLLRSQRIIWSWNLTPNTAPASACQPLDFVVAQSCLVILFGENPAYFFFPLCIDRRWERRITCALKAAVSASAPSPPFPNVRRPVSISCRVRLRSTWTAFVFKEW